MYIGFTFRIMPSIHFSVKTKILGDFVVNLSVDLVTLLYRGSYMSAHVLLNLLNEWMGGFAEHLIGFPTTSLINSIIQEHECKNLFIICH